MRSRWLAVGVVLFSAGAAAAQPVYTAVEVVGPPAELPLIPVPGPNPPPPPPPFAPAGPLPQYEHGYLYIPEAAPVADRPDAPCGPPGRFWFGASLELAATPEARLGNLRYFAGTRPGLNLNGGLWLDPEHVAGVEASYYHLGRGTVSGFGLDYATWFDTAAVDYRHRFLCGETVRLDGLAGYRYGRVEELFRAAPRREARTVNQFHGGEIGLTGEIRRGAWYLAGTGTTAFGAVFENATLVAPRRVVGLEDSRYAIMPTVNVQLGRQLGDHMRAYVGYRFFGMTHVTRPDDVPFGTTSPFWAQGVSLGLELRY
jgi:hypothetical protein